MFVIAGQQLRMLSALPGPPAALAERLAAIAKQEAEAEAAAGVRPSDDGGARPCVEQPPLTALVFGAAQTRRVRAARGPCQTDRSLADWLSLSLF
jgi:hypothetical protein